MLSYPKLGVTKAQRDEFLALVAEAATIVEPDFTLDIVSADPSDNRIIECALAGECQYVVTGDKHLLGLNSFRGIQIITPNAFLATGQPLGRSASPSGYSRHTS